MNQIKNHTQLLNYLAETFNLQSYLEIGVQDPANNFDKIKCKIKIGVDPDKYAGATCQITSDDFFKYVEGIMTTNCKVIKDYDLIFLDGLHHADQVKRDFENSLKCLSDRGFIVIHDTLPTDEKYTHVPRDSKIWYGDVYKFACSLIRYHDIDYYTIDIDCGCTVIRHNAGVIGQTEYKRINTWEDFQIYKWNYLNIISEKHFRQRHDRLHSVI